MRALNNILLDLPVQLGTLVRIAFMLPIYLSHTPPQWHLPSSASHCLRHIAGLHTLGTVEGRNGSWFVRASKHGR
jgi:hypothetical protein